MSTAIQQADPANYTYDPNAAGACLAEIRAVLAGCQPTSSSTALSCRSAFQGHLPGGATCTADFECEAPSDGTVSCSNGVCVVKRRGKLGDPCYWSCHQDGTSTSCSGSGAISTVQTRCFDNDGLYCDGTTSKCAMQLANGTGCSSDAECTSGRCDFASGTCVALATSGQACGFDSDCVDGLYCQSGSRTCAPGQADGAPCTTGRQCKSGSCNGGTCAAAVTPITSGVGLLCAFASGTFP